MADYSSNANNNNTIVADHPFGKVLATGTPLNLSAELKIPLRFAIIFAIVILFVACIVANQVSQQDRNQPFMRGGNDAEGRAGVVIFIGFVTGASIVLYTVLFHRQTAKTEITVYESGIAGTGGGKLFEIEFVLHSFQLTWDKVTSVDIGGTAILGKAITIHASGTQYKCYVANLSEIQGIIVSQQQKKAVS
jgi:NADH:ubiquinone oxidoreductase subunit 3 (subunit A)